jgi:hydroxypyruvate isomerase
MDRRRAIGVMAGGVMATGGREAASGGRAKRETAGRLKQSVSYWPYSRIPLAEFARQAKQIGLVAVDLLQPEEWPVVRDAGLVCSMGYPSKRRDFLSRGFNDPANHDLLVNELLQSIPLAAAAGVPNVIAMFGNRNGRPDAEGAQNCIVGLSRVKAAAEQQQGRSQGLHG